MQPTLIHWPDIRSVLLDMDGTLLDLHFDNHFWLQHVPRRYAEAKGLPLELPADDREAWIIQAGTVRHDDALVTSGGRVLGAVGSHNCRL